MKRNINGFTIVELLVVIVVIGILAAVTIVSYSGIVQRATVAMLQSDLANAAKQLELLKVMDDQYPQNLTSAGLKSSQNTTLSYSYKGAGLYCLSATSTNNTSYFITATNKIPALGSCPIEPLIAQWGGPLTEEGNSVAGTSDGGYVITGMTMSFSGSEDAYISKYDSLGVLQWNKTWGGTNSDRSNAIIQTSDGGYALTGRTSSFGASSDMFLAKFTSDGTLSWSKTWGGASNDEGYDLKQTSDNGYIITGHTYSYGGVGFNSVLLAKYDSVGTLSWSKTWGSNGADMGYSVIQTSDGGYAVAGQSASFSVGSVDFFLAKYTSAGVFSWNKTWGGVSGENPMGMSLIQVADGGYILSGCTVSFGAGGWDAVIVKYNNAGAVSWVKTWGGSSDDYAAGLSIADDGNIVVGATTISFGAGSWDYALVKLNINDGSLIWDSTWGNSGGNCAKKSAITTDDGFVLVGDSDGDMLFVKFDNAGQIGNCSSPGCQDPSATVTNASITGVTTPSATMTSPTAGVSSPSATIATPSATVTVLLSR